MNTSTTAPDDYGQFDVSAVQQPVDAITRDALSLLLDKTALAPQPFEAALRIGNTCGCCGGQ